MVWLFIVLGVYLLVLLGITLISLYPYRIPIFMSPGALGCSQEAVEFQSFDGVTLRGWWVAVPDAKAVAVLSHGYMMNRSELSPLTPLLASKGIASLVFDLRAHGQSDGRKSYLGFREVHDIEAAVAFARAREPQAKIILIGNSMGAASSALAVGNNPKLADALVLDSAYARLSSAVLGWWRFLGGNVLAILLAPTTIFAIPFAGFNPWKVNVAKALERAGNIPVMFFHGEKDNLALPSESQLNLAACQGPTTFVWMPGCGHSEGRWIHPEYYNQELIAFLEKHVLDC